MCDGIAIRCKAFDKERSLLVSTLAIEERANPLDGWVVATGDRRHAVAQEAAQAC